LDETLIHSSFKPTDCDFIIPVEIESRVHKVYVSKRPYVDDFLKRCGELFETVIFTASLSKYADPLLDQLDIHKVIDFRLFRESCSPFKGSYVKDMCRMGRNINQIMIVDNSPHSFCFNPENAIPCETWFSDKNDRELLNMIPHLEELAHPNVTDVKIKLKELGISGLDALRLELTGFSKIPAKVCDPTESESDNQESDNHESDSHESDNHESDNHKSDNHESDNHVSDNHVSDNHVSDNHESDNHESDSGSQNQDGDELS